MPNFILIDPTTKTLQNLDAIDYKLALLAAGLDPLAVDHATIGQIHETVYTIWVYEYGLIKPNTDKYFALGKQLYNGPAILMASNEIGETINAPTDFINWLPTITVWLDGTDACEALIAKGEINRPTSFIDNEVIWEWNKSRAKFDA